MENNKRKNVLNIWIIEEKIIDAKY